MKINRITSAAGKPTPHPFTITACPHPQRVAWFGRKEMTEQGLIGILFRRSWQTIPLIRSGLVALLLAGVLLLTPSCAAVSQPPGARVEAVGDGDSLQVRQGGQLLRVRLACIDAPEQAQRPHGQQAHRALRQQLPIGSTVVLAVKATDRYGRTVAEVVHQNSNINLAMVEAGQAFTYPRHLHQCKRQAYLDAEQRARQRGCGIWEQPEGITRPWDFRRASAAHPAGSS